MHDVLSRCTRRGVRNVYGKTGLNVTNCTPRLGFRQRRPPYHVRLMRVGTREEEQYV